MCVSRVLQFTAFILLIGCICAMKIRHSGGRHVVQRRFHGHGSQSNPSSAGLWPNVFNVATKASITANATCGSRGREEFCRLSEQGRSGRCGVCDASASDPGKRHPIENAIDGTNRWWQSPSLYEGSEYERIDITLDLKQVYQVVYVIVKSGNAPRPGSWILERSLDGITYHPWQYYVINDEECLQDHGIPATPGKPKYITDTDVICTAYYSKLHPLENGEIHTSLINGRPGANDSSPELLAFTRARFVRLRLLRHRASISFPGYANNGNLGVTPAWHHFHHGTPTFTKRLYYAIRDISIGGQCVCSGHAKNCRHNVASGHPECECEHHTCGPHCDRCCPLFNQKPWGPGSARNARPCEKCQCHGHAKECIYDEAVDAAGLSLDIHGKRRGGGVCVNCTNNTTGINCEKCLPGFYRPEGVQADAKEPCIPCPCNKHGTINDGECVQEPIEEAGKCLCKTGYTGLQCERCAVGYKGFPDCRTCPCDTRGTVPVGDCESDCLCKANVEGERCDICKAGYFALRADNFEGCSACYCSGATNVCESAFETTIKIESLEDWQICDMSVTQTMSPYIDSETNWISIGNYELSEIEAYYFLAPSIYAGNQLRSYSSNIEFSVNWVVMRGDTSGKPTTGPNIILIGSNGMRIANGDESFSGTNTTISVTLRENNWYHVPYGVKDIVTRLKRTEYKGDPVTRFQFLYVLADIKYILLRATYHTDQIEANLETAAILPEEGAIVGSEVEKCACPNGYVGLSCESCDYGYVMIMFNTTTHTEQGICIKCNCNGHSPSCEPLSNAGCQCEHNTIGENCERCAPGYYGNPLAGTIEDCKPCACPLLEKGNNFSPSCQLDTAANGGYVCTQCPIGYTGDHCEICDYGYFGSPTTPGSSCQPCVCGGGPCDRVTGQCLSCRGNTEGWRCERCKANHYGDAATANCHPCECDLNGSITQNCDAVTGQCQCKERFTGRTCDRCLPGYGNITAECPACNCHSVGAISNDCDTVSGLCECKPGVEGFRCDACQHLHYGFSEEGCLGQADGKNLVRRRIVIDKREHISRRRRYVQEHPYITPIQYCAGWINYQPYPRDCNCHPVPHRPRVPKPAQHYKGPAKTWRGPKYGCACNSAGSELPTCDIVSGQCRCKSHVIGRNCDSCERGYWGIDSGRGCFKCECDEIGTIDGTCDQKTKQCNCKPGIGGLKCDICLPGYFGFSNTGCKACEYCIKPGHICDPDTGRCVCPINTRGEACEKCLPNSYGHEISKGCKSCNCAIHGSTRKQCDINTGQCDCKNGYTGIHCDTCAFGYYGYPRCKKCDCDRAGTEHGNCLANGLCSCDETGQCACKINVVGKRCNECSNGTFGLHSDNPDGCTQCFCFGRTAHCTESKLTIGHIRLNTSREFEIDTIFKKQYSPSYSHPYHNYLQHEHGLLIIPGVYDDYIKIQIDNQIDQPIYWKLPNEFLGDKILSYGGYLRFMTETIGGTNTLPFNKHSLVQVQGNNLIILEYYQLYPNPSNQYEIRFHESLWQWKGKPNIPVSRDALMVALQKVQHIFIRANNAVNFNKVVLHDVSLDTAIMLPGNPPPLAKGVEMCECPRQYNSSSCQNPSIGFYRWHNQSSVNGTIIINLIGEAKPCECNGRSNICDTETGHCLYCTDNTTGPNCQYCAEGYYGKPMHGKCKPCPCPSKDRNFSRKCHPLHHGGFKCICKTGYSGPKCDSCKSGYYGNPHEIGGSCKPCNCNKYGSASDECDEQTGQCNCRPGMTGKDCSQCESPRHVLQINGCRPCDNCTQWLLDDLDRMSENLDQIYNEYILFDRVRRLYEKLHEMSNRTQTLQIDLDKYKLLQKQLNDYSLQPIEDLYDQANRLKNRDIVTRVNKISKNIKHIYNDIDNLYDNIEIITQEIVKTLNDLNNFGKGHIEVQNAVKQGSEIVDEIKSIEMFHPEFKEKKDFCKKLLDDIKQIDHIYSYSTKDINLDLDDFKKRLEDMKHLISKTTSTINEHDEINIDVVDRLKEINRKIDELNNINLESTNYTKSTLNKANDLFNNAQLNIDDLIDSSEFDTLYEELEIGKYSNVSIPKLRKLVEDARKYAYHLQDLAEKYVKTFTVSHEADLALKASQRYKEIIDILNESKKTAEEAQSIINDGNEMINPAGKNSLSEDSDTSLIISENVKRDAENLQARVQDLSEHKEHLNISISDGQNTIWRTGIKDNQLNSHIHNLTLDKTDMLAIIHDAIGISNKMKAIYKNATTIKDDIQYKLRPELDKLQKSSVEIVSLGEEKLSVAERNIKNSDDILLSMEKTSYIRKKEFTNWNTTLTKKMDELKSRILKAKQAADGIRVSLTNAEHSVCARSYKPYNFGPTTTTNIGLILALNNTNKNASLLYLQTASKDFMALQLVNKHIQYLWNLGGDTGELKTKLPRDISKKGWYKIDVERTANIAKLTIYNKDNKHKPIEVRKSTSSDFTRFDIGPNDKLWIGGPLITNDPIQTNQLNTETGIPGCLSDVMFDGRPIGLWNFINSTSSKTCAGCLKHSFLTIKSDGCFFNGRGYAVMPRDTSNIYKPSQYSIRFDIKTYDENSLLFLAIDIPNKRFVSISLKNGRIQFHIEYGGKSVLILITDNKYNNGETTSVSATRAFTRKTGENGLLEVNNEKKSGHPMIMPEKNSFPNLENATYYIGGVPPEFYIQSQDTTKTLHTHASFMGCIENIQIDGPRYNPLDEKHYERYGVEPSCANKAFKVAGFEDNAFIEMPKQILNSASSFGFVFRSIQTDAILLEAVNPNQIENYYRVSIASGNLVVNINIGKKIIVLTSNKTINDGHYHVVFVKIHDGTAKLRIDDELHDKNVIETKNFNINANIYLGGLPENLSSIFHQQALNNLTGTIKDVIFNDKLLLFNDLIRFEKAKIGRTGPLPDIFAPSEVSTLMMPERKIITIEQPPQCHRIPSYSLETGAVKFGDASNSYVQHVFKSNNFWNKNYTIELEFRTFYLNGLIFVSPGIKEKNRHHMLLTLKDHAIILTIKAKRKKEIIINHTYNDGKWHRVVIQSHKKKVTLTVDGHFKQGKGVKKLNVANMIYIGGVPVNNSHLPDSFVTKLNQFRGCITNLQVNNRHQDLIKEISNHNNVGQCFPHVEKGSYFAGDAYAIFKNEFIVDTQLELQFEFRTSEQNGILISIKDPFSNHGLSLELYNGAVVMMGNMGSNGPSKVKTNLSTEYSLCDNKWHKVTALYSKEEMTLTVDGVIWSSLAINTAFMDTKIASALYIGGLPDDAVIGTLHTRENFKGCIRNVEIHPFLIDWTDMDELQNILLNSCPVNYL